MMNQMEHDLPNVTGIHKGDLDQRIKKYFPDFMGVMNVNGMNDMFEMYGSSNNKMGKKIPFPKNVSPIGNPGPFGVIELGGMFTILKVREHLANYSDPDWYQHPIGTVATSIHDHHVQHENHENTVSWFSKEEMKDSIPKKKNWMESMPEDSMSGHKHH